MIEVHPELFDAVRAGDLTTVQQIINSWDDDDKRYGYTVRSPSWAIIIALRENQQDIAAWLLENSCATPYYVKVYMLMDAENNGPFRINAAVKQLLRQHKLYLPNIHKDA